MAVRSEFSRPIRIEPWPEGGIEFDVRPSAGERAALARRFDLVELRSLAGRGRLERAADGREIRFRGRLEAEAVQTCVVSLEPVVTSVSEVLERRFCRVASGEVPPAEVEVDLDPDEVEAEPLEGALIDVGEILAEELGLGLDPYPRAPDAYALLPELGPDVSLGPAEAPANSPFAVLRQLQHDNL